MARAYTAKVNRHVHYTRSDGRLVTATITAVVDPTHVDLRVGRTGGTASNVARETATTQTNVWKPY